MSDGRRLCDVSLQAQEVGDLIFQDQLDRLCCAEASTDTDEEVVSDLFTNAQRRPKAARRLSLELQLVQPECFRKRLRQS